MYTAHDRTRPQIERDIHCVVSEIKDGFSKKFPEIFLSYFIVFVIKFGVCDQNLGCPQQVLGCRNLKKLSENLKFCEWDFWMKFSRFSNFVFINRCKSAWNYGWSKKVPKKSILEPEKLKVPFLELTILEAYWDDESHWYVYQKKAILISISMHS